MGVDIFLHSVRLVLNNWRAALRISGPLFLLFAIPQFLIGLLRPLPTSAAEFDSSEPQILLYGIIALVAGLLLLPWIATAWHRYILRNEVPSRLLPDFSGRRVFAYVGYSLLIGLLAVLAAIIAGIVAGVVLVPLGVLAGANGAMLAGAFTGIFTVGVALVIFYRFSPVLPAVALDKKATLGSAFKSPSIKISTILALAIVSSIASFLMFLPWYGLVLVPIVGKLIAGLWNLGIHWLQVLVGVSIITTLYGHYVEGRPLPAK